MEREHREWKKQAMELWGTLGNPVYESPMDIEAEYHAEVLNIAKRGRQCTLGTAVLGSTKTKRAIRDHERSDKRRGESVEVARLKKSPHCATKLPECTQAITPHCANNESSFCAWRSTREATMIGRNYLRM